MKGARVVLLSLGVAAGCGGLKTAVRPDAPALGGVDPALVQLTDAMPPGAIRLVSVSARTVDLAADGSAPPSEADLEAMRTAAATHGAQWLVVESVDLYWRKALYGFGVLRAVGDVQATEVGPCSHAEAQATRDAVESEASGCMATVAAKRPGLQGSVIVHYQVDPFGDTYQAAPSPEGSRDGELQRCLMEAVVRADWGAHTVLLCSGSVEAAP